MDHEQYLEDIEALGLKPPPEPVDLESAMKASNEAIDSQRRAFLGWPWLEGDGDEVMIAVIHQERFMASIDGQMSLFPFDKEIEIHGIKCIAERHIVRNSDWILRPAVVFDEIYAEGFNA